MAPSNVSSTGRHGPLFPRTWTPAQAQGSVSVDATSQALRLLHPKSPSLQEFSKPLLKCL